MKRISLLLLLALPPGISQAYGYDSYGVRYSPYAFNYRHSGLISGGVDYTPYAFTYRDSGLVPGYGLSYGSNANYDYSFRGRPFRHAPGVAFRGARPVHLRAQDAPQPVRPLDGMDVIRQHLLAKGITAVEINRIFRVDNQLAGVDILVKDRNLLIEYSNPRQIEALGTKETLQQKIYEKYRQDSAQIVARHEQTGGQVFYVAGSDAETIVAALNSCTLLDNGPVTPDGAVMYARN